MNMTRRGFLGAMLAACAAPAIIRADNIMRVFVPPERGIILWGDGLRDDTGALEAFFEGRKVVSPVGVPFNGVLMNGNYLISRTISPKGEVISKAIYNSRITMHNKTPQKYYMHFDAVKNSRVDGSYFSGMSYE